MFESKKVGWAVLAVLALLIVLVLYLQTAGCVPVYTSLVGPGAGDINVDDIAADHIDANSISVNGQPVVTLPPEGGGNDNVPLANDNTDDEANPNSNVNANLNTNENDNTGDVATSRPELDLFLESDEYHNGDTVKGEVVLTADSGYWKIACPFGAQVYGGTVQIAAGEAIFALEFVLVGQGGTSLQLEQTRLDCRAIPAAADGTPDPDRCPVDCPVATAFFEIVAVEADD